ncbi:MAG TPA: condensation domain-containing protein, partial [Longimicrobiaceae bacterium]
MKIRGFRVEPGEVEAVLRRAPGVADCAVVARRDAAGETVLVAYVAGAARPDALRAGLRERLPEHMVPGAFVVLERLPVTPNGKVDRRALPAPESPAADADYVAPRTAVEERLVRIWCEVFGLDRVGVDRAFLALGGHSLRAMRVQARIAQAFGVEIAPRVLLGSGSIAQVAAMIEAAPSTTSAVPALLRVPREGPIPLSFSQEAIWFFEQLAPGLMAYRAQTIIRVHGRLDVAALERALTEIVRRHEIFRTTFPTVDGRPVQRIHEPWPVRLPVRDASAVEPSRRDAAVREMVREEFLRPFDISALPLVLWSVVRVSDEENLLLMVEHHFVHDGWSFGVFLRELRALYIAIAEGREPRLPEPAVQFADYAVWQRRWLETEAARAKLAFWEAELAGVSPLALATDFPRPAVMRFRGARERVHLPPALAAEARAFGRKRGVTFFITLLAAFEALLGRWSGQRDFCVGSGLGNRGQVALEEVIGMVVNAV